MVKKSKLLEYLITYAEEIKNNDGKRSLTSNYFMIALLKTIDAADNHQIPSDIIDNEEVKKELADVCNFLKDYKFNNKEAISAIHSRINSDGYSSFADDVLFGNIQHNIENEVGNDAANTLLYLKFIILEPTKLIEEYIITKKEQKKEEEDKSTLEPEDLWSSFFGVDNNTSHTYSEEKNNSLSDIIQTTRNIQSVLLENVFGQDHAVNTFVSGFFQSQLMACSRKGTKKPEATFLFAGPPGVGKTFLAEKVADALGLPYMRFDMSEYADQNSHLDFCGADQNYKNPTKGNVTGFVNDHPKCVLLFDEIEKAHMSVIHLFLQLLDAGRVRDNCLNKEVSFTDAVIILTTNAGKNLYDDPSNVNLSAIPRKKVLKALSTDMNPTTNAPLFPAAICSRFASGNVVMFNHLEAYNLYTIVKKEFERNAKGIEEATGIKINIDAKIPSAIVFSEGGKADARTVKGRANAFFYDELYELFRLLPVDKSFNAIESIKQIDIKIPLDNLNNEISAMFENPTKSEVLVFANEEMSSTCKEKLKGQVICHSANNLDEAKDILFNHDINLVISDVKFGVKNNNMDVLNAEDIHSDGKDFLTYVLEKYSIPTYILQEKDNDISQEETLSFAKIGVRDVLTLNSHNDNFANQIVTQCKIAYQQGNMVKLARENKTLSYKSAQTISEDKTIATINLFDFRLALVTDIDDSKNILDNVSRPNNCFDDVIGANDAKGELKYFVEYLKNPIKYMRKGVRSPKGVLLYGPPGTGKTLLAKAMAGESGVTFLKAEGNQFLKKYVGEGPEAVHALFNAARKYAPSIVFIDEIDAIAKDRNMTNTSDTSATLTAFLTEMDGFNTDTSKPVFVLAATNYGVDSKDGKSLDPALLRRFDRRIFIDLPNKNDRKRYLEMKLSKYPNVQISKEQLENIAMRSTGMSLAQLESIFEMALRNTIRSETGIVGDAEFEDAFETFSSGEKKEWDSSTLKRTACHESGHALICWLSGEKPSYLTIVARGDHGGYMQHANTEGKALYTKAELISRIRTSLAGRAAEIVYYGTEDGISTGASGDLYSATKLAEQMLCNYGMDQGVGMSYIDINTANSQIGQTIRDKVNAILQEELDNAIKIIEANKQAINAMVDSLMEKNHLKENEIDDIFNRTVIFTE